MPTIKLRNQPFDLVFHPAEPVLYASLLTGEVKCWRYDDPTGETSREWSVRPTKRTARALAIDADGKGLWMGGKSGILCRMDASMGTVVREHETAHESPINRVHCVNEQLVASGDDEGVIKLWDPRKAGDAVRSYTHHWDYISDFCYFDDKRQLVATSGDGTLSVIDVRSNKAEPMSVSDDQEDELLSIAPIKGGTKCVVGTGLGVLTVWNRKHGWADCVDRMSGHPASVDAIVALTDDVIATGSEDGLVRVIQMQPNTFLGAIVDHDEYPIERLAVDRAGKWLGSVSHDECIKLTDVENILEDDPDAEDAEDAEMASDDEGDEAEGAGAEAEEDDDDEDDEAEADSDSDSDVEMEYKEKKTRKGAHLVGGKDESAAGGFFDGL